MTSGEPSVAHSRAATATIGGVVVLLAVLTVFPVIVDTLRGIEHLGPLVAFAGLELAVLITFALWLWRHPERRSKPATKLTPAEVGWIIGLALPLSGMIVFSADAGYATIALFFVVMWLLPIGWGALAVAALAALVVAGQSVHHGLSFGAFAGPTISAFVAVGIMSATRALIETSAKNVSLVEELHRTQTDLAEQEREHGRVLERARLGRELHDTVAQHLSSIQLLLGAAERSADGGTAAEHVAHARTVAADALTQTRAFIRDLTPPQLDGTTLLDALQRLARDSAVPLPDAPAAEVTVSVTGTIRPVAMPLETALLRIAQESIANARRHGNASTIALTLHYADDGVSLEVSDDGNGFDSEAWFANPRLDVEQRGGFGLLGMRSRLEALGGYAAIVSDPGEGTLVHAFVPSPSDATTTPQPATTPPATSPEEERPA